MARAARALIAGLLFFAIAGTFTLWRSFLFASRDPGPVDFATLERSAKGGDALVCTPALCPAARADMSAPIYTSPAARIVERLRLFANANSLADQIPVQDARNRLRLLERQSPFGTPSFIDIMVVPESSGASTVAMYARSPAHPDHDKELELLRTLLAWIAGDRRD